MLVFDFLAHPSPRDILCCVLCCAYAYAEVCGGGGGIYDYACVKCVGFH